MNTIISTLRAIVVNHVKKIMSLFCGTRICKDTSTVLKSGLPETSNAKSAILRLASTALTPSVRIGILYYSTTRLNFETLFKMFGSIQTVHGKTLEKFQLHSVMLRCGRSVIALRPQQMDSLVAICRDTLISLQVLVDGEQ